MLLCLWTDDIIIAVPDLHTLIYLKYLIVIIAYFESKIKFWAKIIQVSSDIEAHA